MLSDEEKKAVEFVKSELQDEKIARNDYQSLTGLYGNLEIETVLNIIEKQSKEIEELKEDKYGLEEEVQMQAKNIMLCENALCEIQDKIKAKIEELEKYRDKFYERNMLKDVIIKQNQIHVLQSLLEKE